MQVFDNLVQKVDDDPASVKQLYDDWAEGYNANLTAWGYRCAASWRIVFDRAC